MVKYRKGVWEIGRVRNSQFPTPRWPLVSARGHKAYFRKEMTLEWFLRKWARELVMAMIVLGIQTA